jgi:hypothetical protein
MKIDSLVKVYTSRFIKFGSGIQKPIKGMHRHMGRRSHISTITKPAPRINGTECPGDLWGNGNTAPLFLSLALGGSG